MTNQVLYDILVTKHHVNSQNIFHFEIASWMDKLIKKDIVSTRFLTFHRIVK